MLICKQKKLTLSLNSFLRYCKEIANLLFWAIWVCFATHAHTHTHTPKMIVSIWRNLWKNQLHPSRFPWDIAKVLQSCCFGYFWQSLLHTSKLILSICWKLSSLFVGKVSASSTTFFGAIAKIWNLILGTLGMPGYAHLKW